MLHYDTANRDSLAADLMEPLRPVIDRYVLDLIASHVFTRHDFLETRRGQVRILPPLTHHLAATLRRWETEVAPWAEFVAQGVCTAASNETRAAAPRTPGRERCCRRRHPTPPVLTARRS